MQVKWEGGSREKRGEGMFEILGERTCTVGMKESSEWLTGAGRQKMFLFLFLIFLKKCNGKKNHHFSLI